MRREGKQHGLVRSCMILSPNTNRVNKFDSLPAAGVFQKVTSKPTNHSKFTSICRHPRCHWCHSRPVNKSKQKAKGTHRRKSNDVATNHRLVAWRVIDGQQRFTYSGVSAAKALEFSFGEDFSEYQHDEAEEGLHDPATFTSELNFDVDNDKLPNQDDLKNNSTTLPNGSGCCSSSVSDGDDLVIYDLQIDTESEDGEGWFVVKE